MRLLAVIGTRPEAIKLAPVIEALRRHAEVVICVTAQHGPIATAALADFGLLPDIVLPLLPSGRTLNTLAGTLITDLGNVFERERPDWVVVQGDTTSALAGGLAAFHAGLRIAHVEAGLRTNDLAAPFPEEANRVLLARLATLHFAPTRRAAANLIAEGISPVGVHVVGNTVVDAVRLAQASWTAERKAMLAAELGVGTKPLVLVTCHRRENQGEILSGICAAIRDVALGHPDHRWLFPVHPNAAIRGVVERALGGVETVRLVPPLGYHQMLYALSRAVLVVTDSGGLEEEVASFFKPVIVLRDVTERPEGIDAGFARLGGRQCGQILVAIEDWLRNPPNLRGKANPYGDGEAARRIADILTETG